MKASLDGQEALQKALRMLETGARGAVLNNGISFDNLPVTLAEPTDQRIFAVAEAIKSGMTIDEIHQITKINRWFLEKIGNIDFQVIFTTALDTYGIKAKTII